MDIGKPTSLELKAVSIYKNNLAQYTRQGKPSQPVETFELKVQKASRPLVVDTLTAKYGEKGQAVVAYGRPVVKVSKAKPRNFHLGSGYSTGKFLSSCVGAAVSVETHQGKVEGQVLLVETVLAGIPETDGKSTQTVYTHVSLLEQDGSISSVPIQQITKVALIDASLQEELKEALAAKLEAGKPISESSVTSNSASNLAPVYIEASGDSKEDLVDVTYVDTAKEWLCSYRLEMPKEGEEFTDARDGAEAVQLTMLGKVKKHDRRGLG